MLLSTTGPDGTTRYVDQLVAHPDGVEHLFFGWRRALFGRYDVFHVHWPEALVRSRSRTLRLLRRAATAALLARLRLTRTAVVRTVHNSRPHRAGDSGEERLVDALDALVDTYVCLNELTVTRPGPERVVIPLGSYHEPFADMPRSDDRAGLLFFGRIDAYKGVDDLILAFSELVDPTLTLRVVGQPHGDVTTMVRTAAADPRISLALAFVPDRDLALDVTAAELAVLPYRHLENSAVVLVALSLGTPVLARRSPTIELLQEEVGSRWIRLFEGTLDAAVLKDALAWAQEDRPGGPPPMPGRDWSSIGAAHASVYRALIERRTAGKTVG